MEIYTGWQIVIYAQIEVKVNVSPIIGCYSAIDQCQGKMWHCSGYSSNPQYDTPMTMNCFITLCYVEMRLMHSICTRNEEAQKNIVFQIVLMAKCLDNQKVFCSETHISEFTTLNSQNICRTTWFWVVWDRANPTEDHCTKIHFARLFKRMNCILMATIISFFSFGRHGVLQKHVPKMLWWISSW